MASGSGKYKNINDARKRGIIPYSTGAGKRKPKRYIATTSYDPEIGF